MDFVLYCVYAGSWCKVAFLLLWVVVPALIQWPFPATQWRRHYYKLCPTNAEMVISLVIGCTVRKGHSQHLYPQSLTPASHSKIYPISLLINQQIPLSLDLLQVGFCAVQTQSPTQREHGGERGGRAWAVEQGGEVLDEAQTGVTQRPSTEHLASWEWRWQQCLLQRLLPGRSDMT